jgi:hypothetical protein
VDSEHDARLHHTIQSEFPANNWNLTTIGFTGVLLVATLKISSAMSLSAESTPKGNALVGIARSKPLHKLYAKVAYWTHVPRNALA